MIKGNKLTGELGAAAVLAVAFVVMVVALSILNWAWGN